MFYQLIFLSKASEDLDNIDAQYYDYYAQLDTLFQSLPTTHPFYVDYFLEKGMYHKFEENFEIAESYLLKADSMARKKEFPSSSRSIISWQLSAVQFLRGDLGKATRYLSIARNQGVKLKDSFYNDRLASAIFQKAGQYDSAYRYLRKSVDIEYKLGYKKNTLETAILTVRNQTDKLKLDKLKLETRHMATKNLAWALGILFVLTTIIAVLFQKNSRRKHQLALQDKQLQEQRMAAMLKDQELSVIDAMIAGQEKERKRVANELHDDLGSLMSAVKLQFTALRTNIDQDGADTFSLTEKLINTAYGKIRAIAHGKHSGVLAKQGLLQAVNRMAHNINVTKKTKVKVLGHGLENRLENSVELNMFRMIQELVTNAVKHANATEINIHITNHGDSLNFLIEDNGSGFDVGDIPESEGMGLSSIEQRVRGLDGFFTIESGYGKGTTIIIDIPI